MTGPTGTAAGIAQLCALAALVSFSAVLAPSQLTTGHLSGVVRSDLVGPLPDITVVLRSRQDVRYTRTTSDDGGYSFTQIPAGEYSLEISAQAFHPHQVDGIRIDPSSAILYPPIELLLLSQLVTTVEVHAEATPLRGLDAGLTSTIVVEQIEHLPFIGRDVLSLINVEAGVGQNGQAFTTINGLRTASSAVTLDGVSIQDNYIRANSLDFLPNRLRPDQVSEFSVVLQNGRADSGGAASFVAFTTPSGGTNWSGSVYGHMRNSALAANDWFNNRAGIARPHLNRVMPGASVGGPLVPGKLYVYANYEGERRSATRAINTTILTDDGRDGVFTYRDPGGREQQLDLLLATGNSRDAEVERLLRQVPTSEAANTFDVGDSMPGFSRNTVGYRLNASNDLDRDQFLTRWDLLPGQGLGLISTSFQYVRENGERPDLGAEFSGRSDVEEQSRILFLSSGWRQEWGNWIGSIRGGFNRDDGRFSPLANDEGAILKGFVFTNPESSFEREGRRTLTSSLRSDWSVLHGNHRVSFGGQLQRVGARVSSFVGMRPTYDMGVSLSNSRGLRPEMFFGGVTEQDFRAAQQMLASFAGFVSQGSQAFNVNGDLDGYDPAVPFTRNFVQGFGAVYGRHEWRIRPNLLLQTGLRWEYWGRFDERDGLLLAPVEVLDVGAVALLSNATIDFAGGANGRPLTRPDRNNLAPSIGLAWSPGRAGTVFRAGYSVSYFNDEFLLSGDRATSPNQGLRAQSSLRNLTTTLSDGLPALQVPTFEIPQSASQARLRNPTSAISAIDPGLRTPYVQQWHAGVQRRIGRGVVAEARYVGNHALSLLRGLEFNHFELQTNGFLDDFRRAQGNGIAAVEAGLEFDPRYNALVEGSTPLTVIPKLRLAGLLGNENVQSLIRTGEAGELAALYVVNRLDQGASVAFAANPDTFGAHLLTNAASSTYHAAQISIRAALDSGLLFQANYTFSKVLTDAGDSADRFDPYLDPENARREWARADFDLTHAFKLNFVWPSLFDRLPAIPASLSRNWTVSGIATWQSGSPFSVLSGRGTLNRRDRSGRNTATSLLTQGQLDELIGLRKTESGPSIISPSAINTADGTGVAADGAAPFPGQVFYHPEAGSVGTLQPRTFSGPVVFTLDLALERSLSLGGAGTVRIGARAANVLNRPSFFAGSQNLDSPQFGQLTSTLVGGRVVELFARFDF